MIKFIEELTTTLVSTIIGLVIGIGILTFTAPEILIRAHCAIQTDNQLEYNFCTLTTTL